MCTSFRFCLGNHLRCLVAALVAFLALLATGYAASLVLHTLLLLDMRDPFFATARAVRMLFTASLAGAAASFTALVSFCAVAAMFYFNRRHLCLHSAAIVLCAVSIIASICPAVWRMRAAAVGHCDEAQRFLISAINQTDLQGKAAVWARANNCSAVGIGECARVLGQRVGRMFSNSRLFSLLQIVLVAAALIGGAAVVALIGCTRQKEEFVSDFISAPSFF